VDIPADIFARLVRFVKLPLLLADPGLLDGCCANVTLCFILDVSLLNRLDGCCCCAAVAEEPKGLAAPPRLLPPGVLARDAREPAVHEKASQGYT
jgi:hypothetical protein